MKRIMMGLLATIPLLAAGNAFSDDTKCRHCDIERSVGSKSGESVRHAGSSTRLAAPEIDARSGTQALVLLGGVLLLIGERVRRRS